MASTQPDDRRWPVQSTADHLTHAAGRVIARRGSEFSMSEVAAEAGVSRPTLYRYFPTKVDILQAVAAYSWTQFDTGLKTATSAVPAAERLERALDYLAEFQETVSRGMLDVAPRFALERLAEALPHIRASMLGLLADCFGASAPFGPAPETHYDIADRIVRISMSYFCFPGDDPDGLARALRAAAGLPPR
jgi:AcrR family transcriptional regulator